MLDSGHIAAQAIATVAALLIPWVALRRCRGCGQLALRTVARSHRCSSRRHTRVARRWVSLMLLWSVMALLYAIAPDPR